MYYWIETTDGERVSVATCSYETVSKWLSNARTQNPSMSFEIVDDSDNDPYPANMLEL